MDVEIKCTKDCTDCQLKDYCKQFKNKDHE